MSKKLTAEVEKCLREAQTNMQTYDVKWRELKSYNEATAYPDWATLGGGIIKTATPELLSLTGLRPKRPLGLAGYISVDISNLNEKQVNEAKDKLKNELEALMKKTGFSRDHLIEAKKEIESRHRRGKIYFLRGVSSEDTTNEQASQFNEVVCWMQEYIDKLRDCSDQFTAEIESLTRDRSNSEPRMSALRSAVEMYLSHANKLDEFLRGIRNNTISVENVDGFGEPDRKYVSGLSPDSSDDETDERGGQGVNLLLERLDELKELLTPLIQENENLSYCVTEEIYGDLGIVANSSAAGFRENDDVVESPAAAAAGTLQATEEIRGPPETSSLPDSTGTVAVTSSTKSTITPTRGQPLLPIPVAEASTARMMNVKNGSGDLDTSSSASPKAFSYRSALQHVTSHESSHEPPPPREKRLGQPQPPTSDTRRLMEDRIKILETKLCAPPWSEKVNLVLGQGVSNNICDVNLLWQLSPAVREQLLQQVECMVTSQGNALPVLVRDDFVQVAEAKQSWYGEMAGGREITQKVLQESSLLYVDSGNLIEILAIAPQDQWTYGRLYSDKARQGWFPTHITAASIDTVSRHGNRHS